MFRLIISLTVLASYANIVNAECANACNGHGKCTSYDMCICNRNWQANDCSERVCMFGLAHVDTPKGDLDHSGDITGPNKPVIENNPVYPYGTTEQFPRMEDSDLQVLENSAHYYMECSNKGKCDRNTGECQCYDGYDGVACQRASCPGYPNSCSGHGVCKTIKQLAQADNQNVYELWDRDVTMGCECDKGYYGPDCSLRDCKYGVDPLYLDDAATVKYSIFDFATLTTKNAASFSDLFDDGQTDPGTAYWAIRFYDAFEEDWITSAIPAGATCNQVTEALYNLPNDVIADSSLYCTRTSVLNGIENQFSEQDFTYDSQFPESSTHPYKIIYKLALWEAKTPSDQGEISPLTPLQVYTGSNDTSTTAVSGFIYRIKFLGNPGKLKQPEIELYLDGKRPSMVSKDAKVITKVWTDGQQGEFYDYFADHCDGVTTTIGHVNTDMANTTLKTSFLTGFTVAEKNLLKKCLGDSDFDTSNNQDVYNWDKGTKLYPHIVKLVRTVTTQVDGGYYAVLWYDTTEFLDNTNTEGTFKLLNPFRTPDNFATDNYDIYTTKGTLAMTSNFSEATFGFASNYVYMTNVTYDILGNFTNSLYTYDGDISCEVGNNNADKFQFIFHCLNKGDMFTMLNWEYPGFNPPNINLYTAERLHTGDYQYSVSERFGGVRNKAQEDNEMHYMTHSITTDIATNWGVSVGNMTQISDSVRDSFGIPHFHVYKFFPSTDSTYEYVAPCSNRGLCNTDTGVCDCFSGYTSDSCHEQNSLAL